MKKLSIIALLIGASAAAWGQSKTTNALQAAHEDVLAFYFYKNTLRMLNQADNKEFDELIRNVEKLKFLVVDKAKNKFGSEDFKKLVKDYKSESYEAIMTSRMDGRTFDIYFNDKRGSSPGTIVLVNDSSDLYILDMIGTIDFSKAGALFSAIDDSSDIGQKIKDFATKKDKRKGKDEDDDDID